MSTYLARVVDARLKAYNYKTDIKTLLGESQDVKEFFYLLTNLEDDEKRTKKSKKQNKNKAYYSGWNIIYNISHGSIRTLLELIEYIFAYNDVNIDTLKISQKGQDDAVRKFSERHYKAISMLPGEFEGKYGGQSLQSIVRALGDISRWYLKYYKTGEDGRWYETISIEPTDARNLNPKARERLIELIKNGLLLEEGMNFSRGQFGLSVRYDMNKIFSPAFKTTYRIRNHIYLSKERFEEFLMEPDNFKKKYESKLNIFTKKIDTSGTPKYQGHYKQTKLFEDD